jgi:DNA polymerase I-like protein with 3'-5' exonuclease and polymerase domains
LGIELDKGLQKSDWGAETLDREQLEYGAMDVLVLPKIARDQIKELQEENLMGIYSVESKCIRPVALMCHRGFAVDVLKLTELKAKVEVELEAKTLQFVTELDARLPEDAKLPRTIDGTIAVGKNAKKEFNPGSTTQVIKAFTLCGIEVPRDETSGKPTLSQIALSEFDSTDTTLNLYRERVKIETKLEHCEKLLSNVNPITRRIHSQYNSFGANSGRFTCNGAPRESKKVKKSVFAVNIQQVPRAKEYRECFIAEKGFQLVIADYNQMELRLLAELADIPQMQEAYNNNTDLHQLTASLMNNCPIEEVTKHQRQMAKGANFGMIFGIGYRKFKTYAAASFGLQLSLSESKILHSKFHAAYPKLREWHRQRGSLVDDGWAYIRTAMGRRRLLSYDDARMTTAANTLIQGTGADILKIALSELNEYLNDEVRLVAVVHDEIVLEVKEDLVAEWSKKLPHIMVHAGDTVFNKTKLVAEPGVGNDWSAK